MADQSVERDVACANCGYNLRSLPISGRCPECGQSVEDTLRHPDLASQGNRWLAQVQVGLQIIIGTLLFGVLNTSLWFVPYFRLQQFMFLYRLLARGFTHVFVDLAWIILELAGFWLITKPLPIAGPRTEPSSDKLENRGELNRRQFLRFFACFSFVGGFLGMGAPAVGAGVPGLFAWVLGGVDVATIYLFYEFIEKDLATRARLYSVVRQAHLLKAIKPVASVLLLLLIEYLYGAKWINRGVEVQLHLVRELLYVAMNCWAVAVLWVLLQAFGDSMRAG